MKIVPVNSYCRSNATERAIPFGALYFEVQRVCSKLMVGFMNCIFFN